MKIGQDFLDIQYPGCSLFSRYYSTRRNSAWLLDQMVAHFNMRTNDMYANSDEKNLEEGNLTIEITNYSQRIFALIKNNIFSIVFIFLSDALRALTPGSQNST